MAHSRFAYVKRFEAEERLLPNCWTVVRVDGRGFARFVDAHRFNRPNDDRGIRIMNKAAAHLMADAELNDIVMGFGNSDEFSFVLSRRSELFGRRSSKIVSTFASAFSSAYVFFWKECFPDTKLEYPPVFDCRVVLYPTDQNLRDYLAWRQADCHINNLYNTCFWSLVNLAKKSPAEAEEALRGTVSGDKNELLFSQFQINYNDLPAVYRKGSVLYFENQQDLIAQLAAIEFSTENLGELDERTRKKKEKKILKKLESQHKKKLIISHEDIIGNDFWIRNPHILNNP